MPLKHPCSPRGLLKTGVFLEMAPPNLNIGFFPGRNSPCPEESGQTGHRRIGACLQRTRPSQATVSHVCLTSAKAEGTFFCFLKVEGLMLWKTEEKVLPEEKRDEDSGKLMLTGRSAEVRSQGKGLWNASSGPSEAHEGRRGSQWDQDGWHVLSC